MKNVADTILPIHGVFDVTTGLLTGLGGPDANSQTSLDGLLRNETWASDPKFGADRTGTVNSSAAIQAAIDSLPNTGGTTYFLGAAGSENFQVAAGTGPIINHITAKGGAGGTSTAPSLSAEGTTTDIDFRIIPKGAGMLRVGTYTAGSDVTSNGYVSIKTSDGTVRKLMTTA